MTYHFKNIKKMGMYRSKIELHNVDCLPFMKQCEDKQFDLTACEIDNDYFVAAKSRLKPYRKQQTLF
jgi:hypothetical protein